MDKRIKNQIYDADMDPNQVTLESDDSYSRSQIILTGLLETFNNPVEFVEFVKENATAMATFGIIPLDSMQAVTEAVKAIKVRTTISVASQMSRAQKIAAYRLAATNNDSDYKNYMKYRNLMRTYREKIFTKYGSRAKVIARKELAAAGNRAKAMTPNGHNQMSDRIQKAIDNVDKNGRNGTAVPKKS